jgi:class 3 adenylate cyclase
MQRIQALVACSDLSGYAKLYRKFSEEEIFCFLSDYYEFLGEVIAPAGGKVIKFMGDATLMIFPEEKSDEGVKSLLALQSQGDLFLSNRGMTSRHDIRMHLGPILIGELGVGSEKRLDIMGSAVNTVFLLKSSGFTMTTDVFRSLAPETRKLFKKHTPPITYIPVGLSH